MSFWEVGSRFQNLCYLVGNVRNFARSDSNLGHYDDASNAVTTTSSKYENITLIKKYWKKYSQKLKLNDIFSRKYSSEKIANNPLLIFLKQELENYMKFINLLNSEINKGETSKYKADFIQNLIPEYFNDFIEMVGITSCVDFIKKIVEKGNNFHALIETLVKNEISQGSASVYQTKNLALQLEHFIRPLSFLKVCQQIAAQINQTTIDNIILLNEFNPYGYSAKKSDLVLSSLNLTLEMSKTQASRGSGLNFIPLSKSDEASNLLSSSVNQNLDLKIFFTMKSNLFDPNQNKNFAYNQKIYENFSTDNFNEKFIGKDSMNC